MVGLPRWSRGKEAACQCRSRRRHRFNPESGRSLEKEMATHPSLLAWRIPWTEEPGGLQSMGLQRARHDIMSKEQQQLRMVRMALASVAAGSIDSSLFLGFFFCPSALVLLIYWVNSHLFANSLSLPSEDGGHAVAWAGPSRSCCQLWRIPGTGEPGGLPSMGSHRVGHD